MVESGFERRFHDLTYFEVGVIFLKFIIYLNTSSQNFVENHQFIVILSNFKQILLVQSLVQYHLTYLHATCTVF